MVKKILLGLFASATLTNYAFATSDSELIALIKSDDYSYAEVSELVAAEGFNPYRKINGEDVYTLAKRYENTALVLALEHKMVSKDVEWGDTTKLYNSLAEDPMFDVGKLNLLVALNEPKLAEQYIINTIGAEEKINSPDSNGFTPLMTAMLTSDIKGRVEVTSILHKYGANINVTNIGDSGDSAILYACRQDLPLDFFNLMRLGARWLEENEKGENIFEVSEKTLICNKIISQIISANHEKIKK